MIKSVLVAGTQSDDNLIVRYCEDLFLKTEHLSDLSTTSRRVPEKHDATIIAVTAIGKHTYDAVRECYTKQNKPIFISKHGISNIRESFENSVFGSPYILGKLREPPVEFRPTAAAKVLPITARFWWTLCRFIEQGEEVKYNDIKKFFEKFIIRNQDGALSQVWHKGKDNGYLDLTGTGVCRFNGIPENCYIMLNDLGLQVEERFVMRQKREPASPNVIVIKKQPTIPFLAQFAEPVTPLHQSEDTDEFESEIETIPESILEVTHLSKPIAPEAPVTPVDQSVSNTNATLELLLEAMSTQQSEINHLQKLIETRIPILIQNEIRGITKLLGSLVPKLQGLEPHEIEKVDQMIDLFLSMRAMVKA